MSETFENIKILGINKDASHALDDKGVVFEMHLNLSAVPAEQWVEFFGAAYSAVKGNMWRRANIEGSDIVMECPPEEIAKYHQEFLKNAVDVANASYVSFLQAEQARLAAQDIQKQKDRDRLDKLDDDLNFD